MQISPRRGLCLLLLGVMCVRLPAETARPFGAGKATIILDLTDGLGTQLDSPNAIIVSFKDIEGGADFSRLFHHGSGLDWRARGVPFGNYRLKMHGEKFGELERLVDVRESLVSLEVPTRFASVHIEFQLDRKTAELPDMPGGKLLKEIAKIKYFRRLDGTDFVSKFKIGEASEIPYGTYEIEIDDPLNGTIHRKVDVFKPEVWVLVDTTALGEYPSFSGPKNIVLGTVSNIPESERPVYVKLMSIYFEATVDDRVTGDSSKGGFQLAGFSADGTYLLLTIGRSGVLDVREVVLPCKSPIEIDLKDRRRLLQP